MCGKILPFPYLGCTLVFRALALWTTCGAVPQRVHAHVPSRHRRVLLANGLLCPTRGSRVPRAVAITVFLSPTQCFAGWTGGLALSIVAQRVMVGTTCPRVCVWLVRRGTAPGIYRTRDSLHNTTCVFVWVRRQLIVGGKAQANSFPSGQPHPGSNFYHRNQRAHANWCVLHAGWC